MQKIVWCALLSGMMVSCQNSAVRLAKKDREDLVSLLAPMKTMEERLEAISQVAQQIQNYIVEAVRPDQDNGLKECCKDISKQLSQISLVLEVLAYLLNTNGKVTEEMAKEVAQVMPALSDLADQVTQLQAVMGNLDDLSVGQEEFNSVDDIDEAQLSLISWLKTVYRQQLYEKFIS